MWLKFPRTCAVCQLPADLRVDLCKVCYQELPWLIDYCVHCGKQLTIGVEAIRCNTCLAIPPCFDRYYGLFKYQEPVKGLLTSLKYTHSLANAALLGELLAQQVATWYQDEVFPEAIIPVPLHPLKQRLRGFNQVQEILRPVMHKYQTLNLDLSVCQRIKYTAAQAKGKAQQRKQNLKYAFKVTKNHAYTHIAIVDDVVTTGSTIKSLSQVLRNSGVITIDIWGICRA